VSFDIVQARRDKVAVLLRNHRYLPVNELCRHLNISEATARRDLSALKEAGKITRTHGGALGEFDETFASFHERELRARRAKACIARAARARFQAGATYFLDAGTTMLALAKQLASQPITPLTVVTNNLPVAETLSAVEGLQVCLLGGHFLNRQATLLGDKAIAALKLWSFDAAFLGAEGFTDRGIWNSRAEIVAFQRAVLARTEDVFFCLDSTKLGHSTPHLLKAWPEIPHLITDATPAKLSAHGLRPRGRQLIQA
jgi:DeoR/GlpR family transcriptional regulator of sugar metabolism